MAILIVLAALLGLVLRKIGEHAGLGSQGRIPRILNEHGALIRTKRLDNGEHLGFGPMAVRLGIIDFALTLVVLILCWTGLFSLKGLIAGSVDIILVVGVTTAVAQTDAGIMRPFAYSLGGYIVGAVVSGIIGLGLLPLMGLDEASFTGIPLIGSTEGNSLTALVNLLTMVLGTLGTVVAVSGMAPQRTYAREFSDGHVNSIKVSGRSFASRQFAKLEDHSWEPPADRVQDPHIADNVRALKEKAAEDSQKA